MKHEVMVLMSKDSNIQQKLNDYQKDGWTIAGDILVKSDSGHCLDIWMYIPLKRVIP